MSNKAASLVDQAKKWATNYGDFPNGAAKLAKMKELTPTWGERKSGDRVNLEIETMARYAARLAEAAKEGL